jgi:hypothetical protein
MALTVGDLARLTSVTVHHDDELGLVRPGTPVTDPAAHAFVEQHHAHIVRWFYPCSTAMHKSLGTMYVADPRFAANLDKIAPGFASTSRMRSQQAYA